MALDKASSKVYTENVRANPHTRRAAPLGRPQRVAARKRPKATFVPAGCSANSEKHSIMHTRSFANAGGRGVRDRGGRWLDPRTVGIGSSPFQPRDAKRISTTLDNSLDHSLAMLNEQIRESSIAGCPRVRAPQLGACAEIAEFAGNLNEPQREVGIDPPTIVVDLRMMTAERLRDDLDPIKLKTHCIKCGVPNGQPYPEPVEIPGKTTNRACPEEADVAPTNIQQFQGSANSCPHDPPEDRYCPVSFDEGRHDGARARETLKAKLPSARIVNIRVQHLGAHGQLMAGGIRFSYPVYLAIRESCVKCLKAGVLNLGALQYVRCKYGQGVDVGLEEVRRPSKQDADLRRGMVTSPEMRNAIVAASTRPLDKLHADADDTWIKIITSGIREALVPLWAHLRRDCRESVGWFRWRPQTSIGLYPLPAIRPRSRRHRPRIRRALGKCALAGSCPQVSLVEERRDACSPEYLFQNPPLRSTPRGCGQARMAVAIGLSGVTVAYAPWGIARQRRSK